MQIRITSVTNRGRGIAQVRCEEVSDGSTPSKSINLTFTCATVEAEKYTYNGVYDLTLTPVQAPAPTV